MYCMRVLSKIMTRIVRVKKKITRPINGEINRISFKILLGLNRDYEYFKGEQSERTLLAGP